MVQIQESSTSKRVEALTEVNYEDTRKVVLWLVTNMLDFHKESALKVMNGEQEGNLPAWVRDATWLETALELLQKVD